MTCLAVLYVEHRMSIEAIAKAKNLARSTVHKRLKRAGVAMRGRGRPDKRPPLWRTAPLRAEILDDLRHFPAGATVEDLADWLGAKHSETLRAMRDLLSTGKVKIVPVEEEGRAE